MECPLCGQEIDVTNGRIHPHGDCTGSFAFADLAETDTEARYTPSSDWCPHPDRWHSSDADSTEHEVTELVAAFVGALRPNLVVETGAAWGQTAFAIGTVLAGAGVGVLHTIEIDPHRADETRKRCEGLPVVVEQMDSLDFVPPGEVGFAWFDSLLPLRVPEFERYYDYLAPGSIVGFHDTAPHHGRQLWNDILTLEAHRKLLPVALHTPRGVVFAEVVH